MEKRHRLRLGELRTMDRQMAITLEATRMLCGDSRLRREIARAREDHERHVREIDEMLVRDGADPDEAGREHLSPNVLGMMQRVRQSPPGETIPRLVQVERVAEDFHERALEGGFPPEAEELLRAHRDDERRHEHELAAVEAGRCEL